MQHEAGIDGFDYATFSDDETESASEMIVQEKGFFTLPSELFCNDRAKAKNDANLNETIQKVFDNIESSAKETDSESDLKGLFYDIDVNSNKLQKKQLIQLNVINSSENLKKEGTYQFVNKSYKSSKISLIAS